MVCGLSARWMVPIYWSSAGLGMYTSYSEGACWNLWENCDPMHTAYVDVGEGTQLRESADYICGGIREGSV